MRRCSVLKGFKKESELFLTLLFGQIERPEHPGLKLAVVNSDASSAQLNAVEDDVVRIGFNLFRLRLQQRNVFRLRIGERIGALL